MALTLFEVKENAEYNLASTGAFAVFQHELAKEQLANYNKAIELGASEDDYWHEWEDRVADNRE